MNTPRAVLFGKLPSHGDFVSRGLGEDLRNAWDEWLSAGIDLARSKLGARYAEVHDTAPVWRFVAGPGRFGPGWRAGALAPSMDSVGRRFFIVVAVDGLEEQAAAAHGSEIAAAMEDLIHLAFANGLDADAIVACAEEQLTGRGDRRRTVARAASERWWIELVAGLEPIVSDHAPADPTQPAISARAQA